MHPPSHPWQLARRAESMNPSAIREILKITERPGTLNFAGGLPELRQWVAGELSRQGAQVAPRQALITSGRQQGLDLVAKILIDEGAPVLVETPTYLGALQAFAPMQPRILGAASDDEGVLPDALRTQLSALAQQGQRPRFMYLLPNFQNPTGRTMPEARRQAVLAVCRAHGLPVVEDNPYGELWFDRPPPAPLRARWAEGVIYLGSFSKILAHGLRLGYLAAPPALYRKLLQAKQAADLHTPGFNQRVVAQVLKNDFLARHVPAIRARYHARRDAMLAALAQCLGGLGAHWSQPAGGMFIQLRLPAQLDAQALLPQAVQAGMAFVPGAPFYAQSPERNTLRLSFVTATLEQIERGIAALARVLRQALETTP